MCGSGGRVLQVAFVLSYPVLNHLLAFLFTIVYWWTNTISWNKLLCRFVPSRYLLLETPSGMTHLLSGDPQLGASSLGRYCIFSSPHLNLYCRRILKDFGWQVRKFGLPPFSSYFWLSRQCSGTGQTAKLVAITSVRDSHRAADRSCTSITCRTEIRLVASAEDNGRDFFTDSIWFKNT